MASRTALRSFAANSTHTFSLFTGRMFFPPSDPNSVNNGEQFRNGGCGQQRGHRTWFLGKMSA